MGTYSGGRILVLGQCAVDTVSYIPQDIPTEGAIYAKGTHTRPGGSAASIAVGLAASGAPVCLWSALGNDAAGDEFIAELTKANVSPNFIQHLGAPTPYTVTYIKPTGTRSRIELSPPITDKLLPDPELVLQDASMLVVPSWDYVFTDVYMQAVQNNIPTMLGLRALSAVTHGTIPAPSLLLGSVKELPRNLVDKPTPQITAWFNTHKPTGFKTPVVVTDGANGSRVFLPQHAPVRTLLSPALDLSRVDRAAWCAPPSGWLDTIGVRDAFTAGLVSHLVSDIGTVDVDKWVSVLRVATSWAADSLLHARSFAYLPREQTLHVASAVKVIQR